MTIDIDKTIIYLTIRTNHKPFIERKKTMSKEKTEAKKTEAKKEEIKKIELGKARKLDEDRTRTYSSDVPTAMLTNIKPLKDATLLLLHTSFFSRLQTAKAEAGKDKNIHCALSWDYISQHMLTAYNGDTRKMLTDIRNKDSEERKGNKEAKHRLSDVMLYVPAAEYSRIKKQISFSEYGREFKII